MGNECKCGFDHWPLPCKDEKPPNERVESSLAPASGSAPLPSVAGRMEMTHADFQRACQLELGRLQEDPNCDTRLVYLLCEAVRCSRECCDIATLKLRVPNER